MRRATHALWVLYTALAVGLLGATLNAYQTQQWPGVVFFAAAAIGSAMAITHTSWLLDEYRRVLALLDQPARPARLTTRQDIQVAQALEAACCEVWWSTAGAEHCPVHCTRKDQTT